MEQERQPYYKTIYFDLPFLIFVKDGFKDKDLEDWAKAYVAGEKDLPYSSYAPPQNDPSSIIIGNNLPVYLPTGDSAKAHVVNLGNNVVVGIQFLRRINQISTRKLFLEIEGDRTGRVSFSSVRINFDLSLFDPSKYNDTTFFIDTSVDAINKFIAHYKVIANRFYIRPITPSLIHEFYIVTDFSNKEIETHTYYAPSSRALHGLGGSITDDEDNILREALTNEEEPPLLETLELEINDKLDLREWKLAVIEASVLFETWLSLHVRSLFKAVGHPDEEIDDKFYRNDNNKTPLTAYAIAKNLINEATGYDFENTQEFTDWCTYSKDLRNNIVHGKQHSVTRDEAIKCCDSVKLAIEKIHTNT